MKVAGELNYLSGFQWLERQIGDKGNGSRCAARLADNPCYFLPAEVFFQPMIIQFSVKQDDYDCLIHRVAEEDGNARSALRRATKIDSRRMDSADGEWRAAYGRGYNAPDCAYALS